ncbi:MAG TPA: glycine oxidase ThiO, partial [Rubricoccaceae bacterium]|nr:glycine oxidase ThiO [Rubricoccaceae bacterium]
VLVVGGGVIGLGVAWRLAQRGRRVVVFERGEAGHGATWAAAGMLSPTSELKFEEADLYRLGRESLRRWPDFARELEAASGQAVGYRSEGTLIVADDRDSAEALRRLFSFQREHGAPAEWLTPDVALDREPFLSPRLTAAVFSPEDHQVDNRAVVRALAHALRRAGGDLREHTPVRAVVPDEAAPAAILDDGSRVTGKVVVLAAGAWSRHVDGLENHAPPVRPVKGQALALRIAAPFALRHVVRGPDAYLVPKADGRLVVGATIEEVGFDARVTGGGVYRLLEGAVAVVPGVEELELEGVWAGLRPASRDHAPIMGAAALPGMVYATGHYRHGLLLAPVTADEVAAEVTAMRAEESGAARGETSSWLAPFSPRRFTTDP